MMKNLIFFLLSIVLLTSCSTTKLNSYGKVNSEPYKKYKTQAELTFLKIDKGIEVISITPKNDRVSANSVIGTEIIIEQLLKLPDYLGKIIKDRKKKYTQTYKAKNTLDFETQKKTKDSTLQNLPSLTLNRKIFSKSGIDEGVDALKISLTPEALDDKTFFAFRLSDINMNYTKAKTSEKYPYVNLNITIKCTYYDSEDGKNFAENTQTSKSIVVPFKNELSFSKIYGNIKLLSDPFKIKGLKMIEVEVTEINPYFLKLEEMETNLTENEDNLSTILTKLAELIKAKE